MSGRFWDWFKGAGLVAVKYEDIRPSSQECNRMYGNDEVCGDRYCNAVPIQSGDQLVLGHRPLLRLGGLL